MGSKIMEGVNGSNGDFTESRHLASVLLSSSTLERKAALRVLQQMIPTAGILQGLLPLRLTIVDLLG